MKYPLVLLYKSENYHYVDDFFISNSQKLECTLFFLSKIERLNYLFNPNFNILITYCDDNEYSDIFKIIPLRFLKQTLHLKKLPSNIDEFNKYINKFYIYICDLRNRPSFSVFTTCYNSFQKILRAYNSLKAQIFLDWEWVIIDDSENDEHFNFLKTHFKNDNRIRLFNKSTNSGNIGNVKNEAVSLCRGKYVLELDHDDEVLPNCLEDAYNVFEKNDEIGFIYMDFANVYENGNNFKYGDNICFGYGGYYCQKHKNKWIYVYVTPNINNNTLSYLIACPNHPRIWRKSLLDKIGNYCESLPICDDYEVLLKTFLNTTMAKIPKLAYIQYMNESDNNFSLIRNSEINRLGPKYISPIYYSQYNINKKMIDLESYENENYKIECIPIWLRENYQYKYSNLVINNDYNKQICILGIDALIENMDYIKELYLCNTNDFILLENKFGINYLTEKLDYYGFDKMKTYYFEDYTNEMLINYFKILYKSINNYQIIYSSICNIEYNATEIHRHDIINKNSNVTDKYLEIGIEYGYTFTNVHFIDKVGIDPNPKLENKNIIKITSDDYFENIQINKETENIEKFDICFIDGMHLSEYVLRDFNNCIKFLNINGKILIDDILPFNYDEQLRIPRKHFYENNILNYGESWTGDIWKFAYFLLINYKSNMNIKIYNNKNYRGIGCFEINKPFEIDYSTLNELQNYEYFKDFNNYLHLLKSYT